VVGRGFVWLGRLSEQVHRTWVGQMAQGSPSERFAEPLAPKLVSRNEGASALGLDCLSSSVIAGV
jgi:hypothetical protein